MDGSVFNLQLRRDYGYSDNTLLPKYNAACTTRLSNISNLLGHWPCTPLRRFLRECRRSDLAMGHKGQSIGCIGRHHNSENSKNKILLFLVRDCHQISTQCLCFGLRIRPIPIGE